MILLLIPLGGLVLGLGLWLGLRGLGALSMDGDVRPARSERAGWRERRELRADGRGGGGGRFSFGSTPQGVREWAERVPTGCLIAVIATTGLWILAWLIFLIVGLNFLS